MPIFTLEIGNITFSPSWYGAMYAIGGIICFLFLKRTVSWKTRTDLDNFIFWGFLGVILWGRLGYVLLYQPLHFWTHPAEIFAVWKGGMSFHGGFIGVCLAVLAFSHKYSYSFWYVIDRLAVIVPVALWLGRLGNWINQELPGYSPYFWPFPLWKDGIAHFPSPLLQMSLEWGLLFCIMYLSFRITRLRETPARLSGIFLLGYGISRLIAEQFRLPDPEIGYLLGTNWVTLGMVYTLPMIIGWIFLAFRRTKG